MAEPRWLERRDIEAIQADLLDAHGGRPGIREEHLLESALARARTKLGYEPDADIATLAAAYGFGLARNHAFIDGNKRVAFMAMYVFVGINGMDIDAPETEVVDIMVQVASGTLDESALAAWLRGWLRPSA